MKLLGKYTNGNYKVSIFDDGTKIRETPEDNFISKFPECMDVKITDYCDKNCPYCHENSTIKGLHGNILQPKFLDTLQPFTEIAIGGGNPLSHPDLISFLEKLKEKNIIANITVNQDHFLQQQISLKRLVDENLIKGIGISLNTFSNSKSMFFNNLAITFPNAVIHTINGITTVDDYQNLSNKNLKILILGYKNIRRGEKYYSKKVEFQKEQLYTFLPDLIKGFKVVSFDNLAIGQLDVKRLMSKKEWDKFYMGDDGQFTMYIDLVKQEFAKSSISPIRYQLQDNINNMFEKVKNEK
jgi:organic radical activating enzyme